MKNTLVRSLPFAGIILAASAFVFGFAVPVLRGADEISSRVTGTESVTVQTVEKIERVVLTGDTVEITISSNRVLPDGTTARTGERIISRKRSAIASDTVSIGGNPVPAAAITAAVVALAEAWKAQDDAIAAANEAARAAREAQNGGTP